MPRRPIGARPTRPGAGGGGRDLRQLPIEIRLYLEYGLDGLHRPEMQAEDRDPFIFFELRDDPDAPPAFDARRLWREWGEAILAAWIRERPGTRPWAWWQFDAPALVADVDDGFDPAREAEADYLARHGLLTPIERRARRRQRRRAPREAD
ncbi:MAG TPA: hypothetical protein VNI83_04075 [Vicinamibacterales bacterium]|nr:hypothetical protein [Vicinamibacterales bacterium]